MENAASSGGFTAFALALMEDTNWTFVILATTVGFFGLAFILLYPVYRFLRREEDIEKNWTKDAIARRQRREPPSGDGAG